MVNLTDKNWERKYQTGQDRWSLGCPAPPLSKFLQSSKTLKPGRIAVLGCGRGEDAMLFASAGFDVVGFDFSPSAIRYACESAKARALNAQFLQRNIFELEKEFESNFDYVLEHSCFCTIDISLRENYVQIVSTLLKPGGQLIALFYTHRNSSKHPPFSIKPKEIKNIFSPNFDIHLLKAVKKSVSSRQKKEHLAVLQKMN